MADRHHAYDAGDENPSGRSAMTRGVRPRILREAYHRLRHSSGLPLFL